MGLAQEKCEACRAGAPQVSDEELKTLLAEIPDWRIEVRDDIMQLEKDYSFKNFRDALGFSTRVGCLAESFGHHPAITTEWGKVTITWWTHKINGLHRNDFVMAAKTDKLLP